MKLRNQPKSFLTQSVEAPKTIGRNFDWEKDFFTKNDRPRIGYALTDKVSFKPTKQTIELNVNGNSYFLSEDLNEIIEEIKYSKEYLSYEDNWDGLGAVAPDSNLYYECISWLIKHVIFVYDSFGIITKGLEINVCADGSIDLSWVTETARLLVNFQKIENRIKAKFYGISKESNGSVDKKGSVDTINDIDESLAVWMKFLA